ncbi:MAG: hypothetical protein M3P08_18590 [Thermoproteota archaeon]|nr:hypothetical protein [Thermoproteota archaeon]
MALAVIDRLCMEKTLISASSRQKDKRKRCVFCGNLATHVAVFNVEGASLVEWYCGAHVKRLK